MIFNKEDAEVFKYGEEIPDEGSMCFYCPHLKKIDDKYVCAINHNEDIFEITYDKCIMNESYSWSLINDLWDDKYDPYFKGYSEEEVKAFIKGASYILDLLSMATPEGTYDNAKEKLENMYNMDIDEIKNN